MIRTIRLLLLAFAILSVCSVHARQIIWQERPLALQIPPDAETQLILPAPVRVRVPAAHAGVLSVESFGRHVLLRPQPKADLRDVRLVLQDLADGKVVIIDVSTSKHAVSGPVEILRLAEVERGSTGHKRAHDPRVALIRFAAREFYAPPRLRGGLAVTRQSVTSDAVHLLDMPEVVATPLASWSAHQRYVTAVQLRNTASMSVDIDPGRLRGTFELAAFHSTRLLADRPYNRTLVFLVSTRPFGEAIHEH